MTEPIDVVTIIFIDIDFDPAKNQINRAKHGVDMAEASRFEFESAIDWIDDREDYGELREAAIGFIGDRLYYMAFTRRDDENGHDVIRVISLRKANSKEARIYVENT